MVCPIGLLRHFELSLEFEAVKLAPDAVDFVYANYMKIAAAGAVVGSGADIEGLRALAQRLVRDQGADAVILAGTELSLAFDEATCGFPALAPTPAF